MLCLLFISIILKLSSSFRYALKLPITVLAFADLIKLHNFRVGRDFKGHLIQTLTWRGGSPPTACLTDVT